MSRSEVLLIDLQGRTPRVGMARSMTEVGEVVAGRYQVGTLVGRGGMAAVWVGRDLLLDRPVAIKQLSGAGLAEPMAAERFEREARSVAQLAHPNVVAVHDYGTVGGEPYLIMELVAGETVATMLDDGPLTITQAVAVAAQTCDGLAAAHEAGVVHRDIKPSNLIVTPAGVVKICDFGIARMLGGTGTTSLTGETEALGSVSYMAPERVGDHPVDHRVDLYGLGCTLYAMLTGAPPFAAESAVATLTLHVTKAPTPVSELRADVPPMLEALIDELLAKAPSARPADAAHVKARLIAALPVGATAADDMLITAVPQAAALAGVRPGIALDGMATSDDRDPATPRRFWSVVAPPRHRGSSHDRLPHRRRVVVRPVQYVAGGPVHAGGRRLRLRKHPRNSTIDGGIRAGARVPIGQADAD